MTMKYEDDEYLDLAAKRMEAKIEDAYHPEPDRVDDVELDTTMTALISGWFRDRQFVYRQRLDTSEIEPVDVSEYYQHEIWDLEDWLEGLMGRG